MTEIGRFDQPVAIAMLPGGAALITEKPGHLKLRAADGKVGDVAGVPAVQLSSQGGLLGVALAPDYAASHTIYLSYSEPRPNGGSSLALMKAVLDGARLTGQRVIWRAGSDGPGGQFGGAITFAPDGKSLFLSSGERQRFMPAQDPEQALGKILHLTLDGAAWPGNPHYKAGGAKRSRKPRPAASAARPGRPAIATPTASPSRPTAACGRWRWGRRAATS